MTEQATATEEKRVLGTKNGLRFTVEGFPSLCPTCKAKFQPLSVDDASYILQTEYAKKTEVRGEGLPHRLKNAQDYQDFAVASKKLELTKTFLDFSIEWNRIIHELSKPSKNINIREMTPAMAVMVTRVCANCEGKFAFTVSVEATTIVSPYIPMRLPSGMLESEFVKDKELEPLEKFFELYGNETGEELSDLAEAQTLLKVLETKPLKFDKIWHKLKWKLRPEPGQKKEELIAKFENTIRVLLADMAKIEEVSKKAISAVKDVANQLEYHGSTYIIDEVANILERGMPDEILRMLRRALANNLVWLNHEISRLVAAGEV